MTRKTGLLEFKGSPKQMPHGSLFDANCRLGNSEFSISGAPTTGTELIAEMDRLGIYEALVHHAWASGYSPMLGNRMLLEELDGHSRLHGCWAAMPHHTQEIDSPKEFVETMLVSSVRAVRLWPTVHRYSLADWSIDGLFGEFNLHRIPVFLDFNRAHWAENVTDYDQVARLCRTFPDVPVILVREGIGSTRFLYPLLGRFSNLHLEISYYQASGGLADICRKFGARRLLFGTGMSEYAGGPAIAMLQYSEISEEECCRIAGDNLRELLAEVK